MAQTLFLPPVVFPGSATPSSPDPTPLRLLAFSVAEAALQSDPNSPSLSLSDESMDGDWVGPWCRAPPPKRAPSANKQGSRLWDVVERAKERKDRINSSPSGSTETLPSSPPISPSSYSFVLPAGSSLAPSMTESPTKRGPSPSHSKLRLALHDRLNLASPTRRSFPLYTPSAEPSPTKSTFSTLDQSRPPPEFVPRVGESGKSDKKPMLEGHGSPSQRLRSQVTKPVRPASSRHTARLPSLAQIQAKMNKAGHRRGTSVDGIPLPLPSAPRMVPVSRTTSNESIEVLQTPTDEFPPSRPRIVLAGTDRPATPPSPTGAPKEPRLAPFLRERTSGRLAGGRSRPVSMPPLRGLDVLALGRKAGGLTTTPLRSTGINHTDQATVPPPSPSRRNIILNTPPRAFAPTIVSFPPSPTGSFGSRRSSSTASPTLSVPIITCTPAPARTVRNGVEQDSDEEEGDVVLFEGDSADEDQEETEEREERQRRGKQMLERLTLRRRSG